MAPDSGTTSGSRQTLVTGEAARRAALKLCEDLKEHRLEVGWKERNIMESIWQRRIRWGRTCKTPYPMWPTDTPPNCAR